MTPELWITLSILVAALGLLASGRVRADAVAVAVAVALGASGVLTSEQALAGFGSPAVITLLAIFILSEGLRLAGVTDRLAGFLLRLSGPQPLRLMGVVMLAGAVLSLFMNNVAAAALLLPAASKAGRRAGVSLAQLLLPLAFGTLLGGTATLLTTMNIVVSDILTQQGLTGFGLLDFLPVGLPLVGLGIGYMLLLGRRWLPRAAPGDRALEALGAGDLVELYGLGEHLVRMRVAPSSPLVGHSLDQAGLRERCGVTVAAIERGLRRSASPAPSEVLRADDVLVAAAPPEALQGPCREYGLERLGDVPRAETVLAAGPVVVVEAVLAPRSSLIGRSLRQAQFREKYGMTALAIWRNGKALREGVRDLPLAFGDALLLQGPQARIPVLCAEPDLILLGEERVDSAPRPGRPRLALGIFAVTLLAVLAGWTSTGVGMLGGAVAMVLCGILSMEQAYHAVEWRTVFLVAGMLPLSTALIASGAATGLAALLGDGLARFGPHGLLAGTVLLGILLTQVMSGAAVAFVLTPLAVAAAQHVGLEPRSLAMGVALSTSMAFPTPIAHPVNLLVMGPAGYGFRDFVRVGLPLTALCFALIMLWLPQVWPLVAGP